MQLRKLGWTDLELTSIGLGTWAHGGNGWRFSWGAQDDAESIATVQAAVEGGVNWIDTAAAYGYGHAEEVTGQALKRLSRRPIIATKCSRLPDGSGGLRSDLSRASIRKECEDSLRRLQIEVIDLYQMHWPMPDEGIEEGWSAMAELVKDGKARYIGVSNYNVPQLERIRPIHPIASLQPPYSMLVRDVEDETLAYCARHQIGVVAYSPLQKGLLTGKVTPEWVANLPADDHRRNDSRFSGIQLEATMRLVDGLRLVAHKYEISLAQLAIAWVLRRNEVTSAIVGARHPAQIAETLAAGDVVLKVEDIETIGDLLAEHARSIAEKA